MHSALVGFSLASLASFAACGGGKTAHTGTTPAGTHETSDDGSAPVAVAIVFNGQEIWIGNDDLEPENSPARHRGILKGFAAAIDHADFTHNLPAASVGLAISYGDTAQLRVPTGAIAGLTGAALGSQKDYYQKTGNNLVAGIELAYAELGKTHAKKKLLFVVGDGNDTNNDTAKESIKKLRDELAGEHVEVHALIYKGELSDPGNVVSVLDPEATTVNNASDIGATMEQVVYHCCQATTATASAKPAPLALAIVFNGAEVYTGNDDIEPSDSPARFLGILKQLAAAIDGANLVKGVPAGSVGVVISYDATATVKVPAGAITGLSGAALGTQKDYYMKAGEELVRGLALAMFELEKTGAAKKVVIVVSDGNDGDNANAKAKLQKLRDKLASDHVEIHALIYKGSMSDPGNVISILDPRATTLNTAADLPTAFANVIHDCCKP